MSAPPSYASLYPESSSDGVSIHFAQPVAYSAVPPPGAAPPFSSSFDTGASEMESKYVQPPNTPFQAGGVGMREGPGARASRPYGIDGAGVSSASGSPMVVQPLQTVALSPQSFGNENGGAPMVVQPVQTIALPPQRPSPVKAVCETRLEKIAGKEEREYSFTLSIDGQEIHKTPFESFHLIRDRFAVARASEEKQQRSPFPHRYRFAVLTDYIHNTANIEERCDGLERYANELLSKDLSHSTFKQFQIHEGPAMDRLIQLEQQRMACARFAHAQEIDRANAVRQKQLADCAFVETFQRSCVVAPGQISSICYPQSMPFILRNKMFGLGDASIRGPGDLVYFKLQRTDMSLFHFKDCQFQITSGEGQPLLMMQEKFAWMDYKYDLSRISNGKLIPVCQVRRHWQLFSFTDCYTIMLYGPMSSHPPITCKGAWPHDFQLTANGRLCAKVTKQLFTLTDTYDLIVHANEDCLLFVGIACAIDRIHHEVEHHKHH